MRNSTKDYEFKSCLIQCLFTSKEKNAMHISHMKKEAICSSLTPNKNLGLNPGHEHVKMQYEVIK